MSLFLGVGQEKSHPGTASPWRRPFFRQTIPISFPLSHKAQYSLQVLLGGPRGRPEVVLPCFTLGSKGVCEGDGRPGGCLLVLPVLLGLWILLVTPQSVQDGSFASLLGVLVHCVQIREN